ERRVRGQRVAPFGPARRQVEGRLPPEGAGPLVQAVEGGERRGDGAVHRVAPHLAVRDPQAEGGVRRDAVAEDGQQRPRGQFVSLRLPVVDGGHFLRDRALQRDDYPGQAAERILGGGERGGAAGGERLPGLPGRDRGAANHGRRGGLR